MEDLSLQTKTDFITALKKKGLKVTKHRNSLLEVLEIENQPLTAEDIFLKLKEQGISINLSVSITSKLNILLAAIYFTSSPIHPQALPFYKSTLR